MTTLPDLVDLVEDVADMRFPPEMNARIQDLMDRNNDGALSPDEREELSGLVTLSEQMSLVRARALLFLGRKPT